MQLQRPEADDLERWPEATFWKGRGARIRLRADRSSLSDLASHCVAISAEGTIEREGARAFSDVYHHGPYARRIALLSSERPDTLFAVFAFRGWRKADVSERDYLSRQGPRLCALELRMSASDTGLTLDVIAATSAPLDDELHALEVLDTGGAGATLIGGCAGLKRSDQTRTPFVRIRLTWQSALRLQVEPLPVDPEPRPSRSRVGAATALAEADWNPCAAIAIARPAHADGRLRLWGGFHDGQLLQFASDADASRLTARGLLLQMRSSIWSLAASRAGRYVAYGTAGGTIGAVDTLARRRFGAVLPMHAVHSHERAPVCSLAFIKDERERLLGLTQLGILSVHDVDAFEIAPDPSGRSPSLRFPGYRVDRFSLGGSPRAMAVRPGENGRPLLLVGDADGGLRGLDLMFPRGTRRRQLAAATSSRLWRDTVRKLQAATGTSYGTREPLEWLRAVDVNGDHLFRFALWSELRAVADGKPEAFLQVLSRLREDAFHRRPFSHEPAKILWEEGAKYAKRLSESALRTGRAQDWEASLQMHKAVDDLCNRWIGQDHAIEAAVLAHSFKQLFNWSDIELLCSPDPSRAAAELRTFVIFTMVERRLTFGGPIVPLEAVRIIVAALVASLSRILLQGRSSTAGFTVDAAGGVGLYDLALIVGELARRLTGTLGPADALFTEIARCFGSLLLRLPEHSLLIYQVMSESGLIGRGSSMADATRYHARQLAWGLARAVEPPDAAAQSAKRETIAAWHRGLALFKWAAERRPSAVERQWTRLRGQDVRAGSIDNRGFLNEMQVVLRVAEHVSILTGAAHRAQLQLSPEDQAWLDGRGVQFFSHTRAYFARLFEERTALVNRLARIAGEQRGQVTIDVAHEALAICDRELEVLEGNRELFEPQKSQYAVIVRRWRQHFETPALRAVSLLQVVNKFNRHVYRTQTDALLAAVIDLALRTSPRWLDHAGSVADAPTFDALIREGLQQDRLVRAVYEGVTNLVSESHLVGALLAVAHDRLFDAPGERAGMSVKDLIAALRLEAAHLGLDLEGPEIASTASIPGAAHVWRPVAGELCKNLVRHGVVRGGRGYVEFSEESSCQIRVYGDRPFVDSLTAANRAALESAGSAEQVQEAFSRILAEIRTATPTNIPNWGVRGGYGLAMIDLISQFLGVSFSCRFGAGDPSRGPLVSVFEWEVDVAGRQ
jgi:hypothetical protein